MVESRVEMWSDVRVMRYNRDESEYWNALPYSYVLDIHEKFDQHPFANVRPVVGPLCRQDIKILIYATKSQTNFFVKRHLHPWKSKYFYYLNCTGGNLSVKLTLTYRSCGVTGVPSCDQSDHQYRAVILYQFSSLDWLVSLLADTWHLSVSGRVASVTLLA